jgi:tetratricopeptide (TPR) repeat protein
MDMKNRISMQYRLKKAGLFFFLLIGVNAFSASPDEQFSKANVLYRSGNFKEAATSYESLIAGGYRSASVYYNLGNAYYKLENVSKSILNYERALRISPRDEDIIFNLRLANLNTVDKIEPVPKLFYEQWWDSFISTHNSDIWSAFGISGLWIAFLFAVLYIYAKTISMKKATFFAVILFAATGIFFLTTAYIQNQRMHGNKSAIIMETSAYIKSSPDEKSTNLFMLHAGTRIDIVDELSGWKKIRIANGNVGWLSDDQLEII